MKDYNYTLIAENIHKSFGNLKVLRGLTLKASKGDVVSIIGSSGSGKSTFLRCINFLETPDNGRVILDGEEVIVD
ncbi:ATP-binding cassette domain-containing protein, partial [Amylibacter sp.]|nr:ATP-binding cassette domain-containing protein [Amylibacter sp.]